MSTIKPNAVPQLDHGAARKHLNRILRENPGSDALAIAAACPVMIFGVRGYFRNTLGRLGLNDFGVYDDAAFLVSPADVSAYNWNCDPVRKGWNPGVGKNYAQLMPGVWPFRLGPHKGRPGNLRQLSGGEGSTAKLARYFSDGRARGHFTVRRVVDDNVGNLETGYYAINIHDGTDRSTGSWGCQTLPPDQHATFSQAVYALAAQHGQSWPAGWIPYVLTEEKLA